MLTAKVTDICEKIEGVEVENLGPCQPAVNRAATAAALSCLWS